MKPDVSDVERQTIRSLTKAHAQDGRATMTIHTGLMLRMLDDLDKFDEALEILHQKQVETFNIG